MDALHGVFLFRGGPAPNTLGVMSMKTCKGSACKDLLEKLHADYAQNIMGATFTQAEFGMCHTDPSRSTRAVRTQSRIEDGARIFR